jgi:hypothetical protein
VTGGAAASYRRRMTEKPLRCRLGLHSYVAEHPADERLKGPGMQVCRRCGKRRDLTSDMPPSAFTG